MKGFPLKVQEAVFSAQNSYCKVDGCYEKIVDFHHRLPQSKVNIKLYPLFIDSPFNCVGLCRDCHTNRSFLFTITIKEAEAYESWLRELKGE